MAVVMAVLFCLLIVATMRDSGVKGVVDARAVIPPVPATVTERPAKIDVTVENEEQKPVESATVRVLSIQDDRAYLAAAARTDAAGKASIAELPAGETWILVEAEGTARASTRLVLDAEPRSIALKVEKAQTLRVAVADDGGAIVADASIEVATGDPLPFVGRTDSTGIATFSRLARAPWNVQARAAGFEAATAQAKSGAADPFKMTLKRLGFVDVNVVDADGAPIGSATVYVAGSALWPARRTQTDPQGHAKVSDLPRGIYDFRAVRGDLVSTGDASVSLGRGESKSLTLTVIQGRKVAVRVVNGE
ncbi:MAG: carboxypeptidase-like regulatory domain-containing protein, partial [Polyangiaceae bacterium]